MTWYRDSVGEDYLEVYAHRDDRQGSAEAMSLVKLLDLDAGTRLLDLACGTGRHSAALAIGGFDVVGIDLSAPLLERARERPVDGASFRIVRGDMRRLPFADGSFGAVTSLFTSFGYFPTREEDGRVLSGIARVLEPGGRFLLDFLNAPLVIRELVPRSEEVTDARRIVQSRSIHPDGPRVEKKIEVFREGSDEPARVFHESVRLYDRADLTDLLREAGLEVDGAYGSFRGEAHTDTSPRTILTARKIDR